MQTGLDAIATQISVSKSRANAILREAMRMDAQLGKQRQNGRRLQTIALQFNHHKILHKTVIIRTDIMESQIRIDGQSLSLSLVDQRNTIEAILNLTY